MAAITVIIPVYNVEDYLERCVNSVLAQSFTDYTVILVNDGSTDGSGALCDRLSARHPQFSVIHQRNRGLGGARNTGIEAADGEYLLFLDSDDYLHPEALARCYELATRQRCDMVLFDQVAVDEAGNLGAVYDCRPVKPNVRLCGEAAKAAVAVSSACNRFCKRTLFTETDIRFPGRVWYEDLRTVPKLIPYANAVYYDNTRPLYYYFQRSTSIMHTPNPERLVGERLAAIEAIWYYFEQNGLLDRYREEVKFLWIFHAFILPVRELQAGVAAFEPYADRLRAAMQVYCRNPAESPYLSTLTRKERLLFNLYWKRWYKTARALAACNRWLKTLR